MDLQLEHYYQTREGETIKILGRQQKEMLLPPDKLTGHLDPDHKVMVDCFICRDDEGVDFYVLPTGQACNVWKGKQGEAVYSLPDPDDPVYLTSETSHAMLEKINLRRYEEDFQKTWRLEQYVALSINIRAKNAEDAYDQLPAISVLKEALVQAFKSSSAELVEVVYDWDQNEIEEDEESGGEI